MTHPFVYEVHARQWLAGMRQRDARVLDLARVPDEVLDHLAAIGTTHLWLMGVWETGARAREQALQHAGLRVEYDAALPGWTDADVVGSPYAIADVRVAGDLGGDAALVALRRRLERRAIGLVLDFVPNHLGLDHDWLRTRPELFVGQPTAFPDGFPAGDRFIAHGKDPYFPGWTDTAQLDHRRADTRAATHDVLRAIAGRCDAVRCDMAMLVLADIFERTWAGVPIAAGATAATAELWPDAIADIKRAHPGFGFIAEAYWGLEDRLCALGFDHAYDKQLYDLVVHGRGAEVQAHVRGIDHTRRVHFLENHDEPRIGSTVGLALHRAAAVLVLGLPGMRLVHDGQLEGARRFARIQLGRRAIEDPDAAIAEMYAVLLRAFAASLVGRGEARVLAPMPAAPDDDSARWFTVIEWRDPAEPERLDLVVVNLAPDRARCRVVPAVQGLAGHAWRLADRLGDEVWIREGNELASRGLYLELPAHGAQLFEITRTSSSPAR
ncbi:MAG: alpha-amylase [Deltaproteobacteria bacterium]|nr:alpha-amylase [Deltaproteobacteria bacterium]MDQ3300100.1 alpha-amylase family glycosyl hydrolase [Myxococcota bacterium]